MTANSVLEVVGVRKSYGGIVAVNDVSLTLGSGEVLGIVGPNGAGKSTLFDLISGVQRTEAGAVYVLGEDITTTAPHRIAKAGLARTFQKLRPLAGLTVTENVLVGAYCRTRNRTEARAIAAECVHAVRLGHKAEEKADRLSTGQRKRLEVARALATGPQVMLLDEITAGVDPAGVPLLIDLVNGLKEMGLSIVIIEHRMRVLLEVSDRLLAMHLGEKIAEGDPTGVMNDPAVIERYLGSSYVEG